MNSIKSIVVILAVATAVAGCIRYPSERVDTTDERPSIAFQGAPEGSQIFVDGVPMGSATQFDGVKQSLLVEPGNHVVEVRQGGRTLFTQRVYLGSRATKTFAVR